MEIIFRYAQEADYALILANIIAKHKGNVFSVVYHEHYWLVWATIHPSDINPLDQAIGAWVETLPPLPGY